MNPMSSLLENLHDIEGLDSISMWPLAIGWWVVIILGAVLFFIFSWFIAKKIAFMLSWRNDTLRKLAALEKNLSEETATETVITLSEYMRRIVLQLFPRKECAGLVGKAWLTWLTKYDPKKFDWENKGLILIELPYAPKDRSPAPSEVRELIQATKNWVR